MTDILLFLGMALFVLWIQNGMRKKKKPISESVVIASEPEKKEVSLRPGSVPLPKKEPVRLASSSVICQKVSKRSSASLGMNWKSKKGLQKAFVLSEILKRPEEKFR